MNIPYSACGKEDTHEAHEFGGAGIAGRHCLGFTVEDQISRQLFTEARAYILEHYGAPARDLPAGLRMEMHPTVLRALRMSVARWSNADLQDSLFEVPMKVNPDLTARGWRLVIVTEDVLLAGGRG